MPNASDDGGDRVATRITHGEGGDSVVSVDSIGSIPSIGSADSSDSLDEGRQSTTPTTPASKSPAAKPVNIADLQSPATPAHPATPAKPFSTHKSLRLGHPQTPKTPLTQASPPFARSFDRQTPNLDLTRGLNLHALGISTSPLGPLERRISFASNSEAGSAFGGRGELERFRDYGPGDENDDDAFDVAYTNDSSDFGLVEDSEPDHDLDLRLEQDRDREFEYSYNDGTDNFDTSMAEGDKDVLIDRLQDVVRHVSSYTPSSPSHSTRTRSAATSAQSSPLRDNVATPAGKNAVAATTPASRSLMAVTTPAKITPRTGTGAVADTPTPRKPAVPFNTPDENVMNALHAHIDEMEAVLAAAEAAANAAAAASPRNRQNQHGRHYPWQRSSERRLRPTSMSLSSFSLDGSSEKPDGSEGRYDRIGGSARSSPQKRRGPFLEAAPVLIRNQSAPPKMDRLVDSRREFSLQMSDVAEVTEGNSAPTTPTTEKTDDYKDDVNDFNEEFNDEFNNDFNNDFNDVKDAKDNTKDSLVVDAKVIGDCEALADDLSTVLASLMRRSQEADAIQQALMAQLEAANQRNAELEAQVEELQEKVEAAEADKSVSDKSDNTVATVKTERADDSEERLDEMDSELSFLRLQLRGIEVQCRSYIPKNANPELEESIANWKADWAALRGRVGDERDEHDFNDSHDKHTFTFDRSNSTF